MAISNTSKLITLANLQEFKSKYTDKYVGDIKLVKDSVDTQVTVKEYVDTMVDKGGAGSVVTMDVESTPTEGYLKTYTLYQGEKKAANKIGSIDIPKELVVTAGEVVVNPDGQAAGTYLKLTIANQEAPVFINVADLCDVYTAAQGATQIQLAVSATNEISATVVAGSITKTELATAVVSEIEAATAAIGVASAEGVTATGLTKRIEDLEAVGSQANVLESVKVNGSELTIADKAVDILIATGATAGTIAVNNVDVAVNGLGDMAYETKSDYVLQADVTLALDTEVDALFA